jgi:trimeric autotransporter adhesin
MTRWTSGLFAILLGSLAAAATTAAEPVRLVADLATDPTGQNAFPSWLRPAGDQLFFLASMPFARSPKVLWRSDGTAAGTRVVHAFPKDSDVYDFRAAVVFENRLTFQVDDPFHGQEHWITDGTAAGTYPLEACPGPCDSNPSKPVITGPRFVFAARTPEEGFELWSSDGTPEGTALLKSLRPGPESGLMGFGDPLQPFGDQALFAAFGEGQGQPNQLWITDGTLDGTRPVFDPGSGLTTVLAGSRAGQAFFLFAAPGAEPVLWATDGTTPGTRPLRTLAPPAGEADLAPLAAEDLVFELSRFDAETRRHWPELWRTDGTTEGTAPIALFRDLYAGEREPSNTAIQFFRLPQRLLIQFDDGVHGAEPWVSDGTRSGTRLLLDLLPGAASSFPEQWIPVGDRTVFSSHIFSRGVEVLWATDGTAAGTRRLLETNPGQPIWQLAAFQDRGIFFHNANTHPELWQTDGTPEGTGLIDPMDSLTPRPSSNPEALLRYQDQLAFLARGDGVGRELFLSDGSAAGTFAIDLEGGPFGSLFDRIATSGDDLLLQGFTLVQTDGTLGNSHTLAQGLVDDFAIVGRTLFHSRYGSTTGQEPWVVDLDTRQSRLLRDIDPGRDEEDEGVFIPRNSYPSHFTPFQHRMYFFAESAASGRELWSSNGRRSGTRILETIPGPATENHFFSNLVAVEEQLFLSGSGVWATRGEGDAIDKFFTSREGFGITEGMTGFRGRAFFVEAPDEFPPRFEPATLWSGDGTPEGNREILRGAVPLAAPHSLTAAGFTLFFVAMTAETGWELWATDGTPEGTRMVKDIRPGPGSSLPRALRAVDGMLLFSADDGIHGFEPWISDGTPEGTRLLADLAPGPGASFPEAFTPYGGEVIFAATSTEAGRELFALDRGIFQSVCAPGDRRLCLQDGRFAVEVDWRNPRNGDRGVGHAGTYSDDTGTFWFFNETNIELLVKTLDGRALNENFWFFSGALSDVAYWITVTDFMTGRTRTYFNPPGNLCGQADVGTFDDTDALPTIATIPDVDFQRLTPPGPSGFAALAEECPTGPDALQLLEGRFAVEVEWQSQRGTGGHGVGTPVPGTDESGYFWFFDPANLELAIKVLDGRSVNGHFWVLYGALSDVAYTIRVTDTTTCETRIYTNPEFNICGDADILAF